MRCRPLLLLLLLPALPAGAVVLQVAQCHPRAADGNPGTAAAPLRTIGAAVKLVRPGDTVLVDTGVYRETVTVEAAGTRERPIRLQAAPQAHVVLSGADVLTGWRREEGSDGIYSSDWPHVFLGWSKERTHPADRYHQEIGRAEQVVVGGYLLKQVLGRALLSPGTFYVDEAGKRLYAWDRASRDLSSDALAVEAATRAVILRVTAPHVQVRGLRFRYAANAAQAGAVCLLGDYDVLEDCLVEQTNSCGAAFAGTGLAVRRCTFRDNGQLGFSAHTTALLMSDCLCAGNNTKGFSRGWEAGGNKLVLCKDTVIERSVFRDNRGTGLWFDIGNEASTVRNCLVRDNEDAGLFYEISYGLHAHDNVIIGNGFSPNATAWGANGGLTLSSSPGALVERNLLIANKEGFQFREQGRTTPRYGEDPGKQYAVWNHDSTIRHNVLAYNRDFQSAGWFDVPAGWHWPRALQAKATGRKPGPAPALAAHTDLNRLAQMPAGLVLEDLRLHFSGNLYAIRPGQSLVRWGCFWRYHQTYETLDEVRAALQFEQDSRLAAVQFQDWPTLDLRVPADSPLLRMGCYPRGEVPGVRLGALRQ